MVQIVTKLPCEGAVKDALIREIRTGFEWVKANEQREELMAAKQAQEIKNHRTIDGLGKCVAMIPPDEYFRMIKKYGRHEVHSKEFLRYFNKKYPHLSPNKA
jgi:hypothetical protein